MIVVTGGTGHIGNVLVRELVKLNYQIRVLIPEEEDDSSINDLNIEIKRGDIRNADFIEKNLKDADVVFHLAGIISIMPGNTKILNEINVEGTKNIINSCIKNNIKKLIYTSSIHAFVEPPKNYSISETTEINPDKTIGEYAKSKSRATLEVLKNIDKGLNAVIVFPTGVLGPYDYKISEMGNLILDYIKKKLFFYIDGYYDFVDVRDVVNGHILAMEKGEKGDCFILSGQRISVKEILNILSELTNIKLYSSKLPMWLARFAAFFTPFYYKLTKVKPRFTPYSIITLNSNSFICNAKACEKLGYQTRSLKETLRDSIEWFKESKRV